jgi:hypothetical protein
MEPGAKAAEKEGVAMTEHPTPEEIAAAVVLIPLSLFYLLFRWYMRRWSRNYVRATLARIGRRAR